MNDLSDKLVILWTLKCLLQSCGKGLHVGSPHVTAWSMVASLLQLLKTPLPYMPQLSAPLSPPVVGHELHDQN